MNNNEDQYYLIETILDNGKHTWTVVMGKKPDWESIRNANNIICLYGQLTNIEIIKSRYSDCGLLKLT